MHNVPRHVVTLSVSVMLMACVTACAGGSGSTASQPIARFAGQTITKATLDHWIPIAAVTARQEHPQQPAAGGARQRALQILIGEVWTTNEAATMGIGVSDREVEQELARQKRRLYPSEAALQRYLKDSGQSLADMLFLLRYKVVHERLAEKIIHQHGLAGASRAYAVLLSRWAAKTSCAPGYVVPDCSQYRGSAEPEAAI